MGPSSEQSEPSESIAMDKEMRSGRESAEGGNIRKHLVLLHDFVAVKFVSLPGAVPPTPQGGGGGGGGGDRRRSRKSMERAGESDGVGLCWEEGGGGREFGSDGDEFRNSWTNANYAQSRSRLSVTPNNNNNNNSSSSSNNNSSVMGPHTHGFYLYKSFREMNLKCYWNGAIVETFENLDYRGSILPSTIFVSAIRKFLTLLRNAWVRQMLRSPPGFRIEFIGDVEEIICEPIQQSHFSPLSDSLCWAIFHITDRGEEAGIHQIWAELGEHFSGMVQPSLQLVHHTLDRLTRERKVYQTSRGFFIVTPDTFRYITTSTRLRPASTHSLTLDCLYPHPHPQPSQPQAHHHNPFPTGEDRNSLSRQSWDSAASNSLFRLSRRRDSMESNSPANALPLLRRYNSLKLPRNKDILAKGMVGAAGSSLRLSKSKQMLLHDSHPNDLEDLERGSRGAESSDLRSSKFSQSHEQSQGQGSETEQEEKSPKKGKGFLSKIFGFGSRRKSKREEVKMRSKSWTRVDGRRESAGKEESEDRGRSFLKKMANGSKNEKVEEKEGRGIELETLLLDDQLLGLDSSSFLLGAYEDRRPSDPSGSSHSRLVSRPWNSLPKRNMGLRQENQSRRSVLAIVDQSAGEYGDSCLWTSQSPNLPSSHSSHGRSSTPLHEPSHFHPHPPSHSSHCQSSSRSSTLSQGTSLGYGSHGPHSFVTNRSQSPSTAAAPPPPPSTNSGRIWRRNGSESGIHPETQRNSDSIYNRAPVDAYRMKYGGRGGGGGGGSQGASVYASKTKSLYETISPTDSHSTTSSTNSPTYAELSNNNCAKNNNNNNKTGDKKKPVRDHLPPPVPPDMRHKNKQAMLLKQPHNSTTKFTHNVHSTTTTNMALELLLPPSTTTTINNNNNNNESQSKNNNNYGEVESEGIELKIGETEIRVGRRGSGMGVGALGEGQCTAENGGEGRTGQVKTFVDENGRIETHFDSGHGHIKSTIHITRNNPGKKKIPLSPPPPPTLPPPPFAPPHGDDSQSDNSNDRDARRMRSEREAFLYGITTNTKNASPPIHPHPLPLPHPHKAVT